jgi:hypothetical protein
LFGAVAGNLKHDDIFVAISPYIIPFGPEDIGDAGHWIWKPESHSSVEDALPDTARYLRRAFGGGLPLQFTSCARRTRWWIWSARRQSIMTCRWR